MAVPLPLRTPVTDVDKVMAGVDVAVATVPAKPLAETTLVLVTEPDPGPVNAISIEPAPGVMVTPDPAVKDALVKVLPVLLPISSWPSV